MLRKSRHRPRVLADESRRQENKDGEEEINLHGRKSLGIDLLLNVFDGLAPLSRDFIRSLLHTRAL